MFFHQRRGDEVENDDEVHEGSVGSVRPLEPETAMVIEKGSLTKDVTQNNEQLSSEHHVDDVEVDKGGKQQKNLEGSNENNSTRNSQTGKTAGNSEGIKHIAH